MDPTIPRISAHNLPPLARDFVFTAPPSNPDWQDIKAVVVGDGRVVTAWMPSAEEIEQMKKGVVVYLTLYCGRSFPGVILTVGEPPLVEINGTKR